jgi:UDP-N-acetylmuramoylalanine--D-glutamate ligase
MSCALVLGLGESGLAMARWLARDGVAVRVWDSRDAPPKAAALKEHLPGTMLLSGPLDATALAGIDRIYKSPGLAPNDGRIAAALAAARRAGVAVSGELDLFVAALASLRERHDYAPKLIAITGTNGKTTTTAMTALLVERSGKRVAAAGNIGPTMMQTLADGIDAGPTETLRERLPEVWVLELSSFQLAGMGNPQAGFDADAAALLNLSEDHLDWHGSFADYAAAKALVFGERATIVVGRDDAEVMRLVPAPKALPARRKGRPPKLVARRVVTFGAAAPERGGDWGLAFENDMAWLVRARDDSEIAGEAPDPSTPGGAAAARPVVLQHLMPADALRIRGRHNALNALAALALATAIGCPLAPMLHALRAYSGEPHRVEYVATVAGVDAYDDSKGTNVGATVAALVGLGQERAPKKLVVILGGDGKGQDFAPLAAPLGRHVRAVLTIGRDAAAIEAVVASSGVPFERCATLEAAVQAAFDRAQPGDAVLLSPACASLDMFRNYGHRAEVFVAAVHEAADRAFAGSAA